MAGRGLCRTPYLEMLLSNPAAPWRAHSGGSYLRCYFMPSTTAPLSTIGTRSSLLLHTKLWWESCSTQLFMQWAVTFEICFAPACTQWVVFHGSLGWTLKNIFTREMLCGTRTRSLLPPPRLPLLPLAVGAQGPGTFPRQTLASAHLTGKF